jgi:hypothetical protein
MLKRDGSMRGADGGFAGGAGEAPVVYETGPGERSKSD